MISQEPTNGPGRLEVLRGNFTNGEILDTLSAHIAILDASATILAVNEAWKRFGRSNNCPDKDFFVGSNYLKVCENAVRWGGDQTAKAALDGIRAILAGEQDTFTLEYPCHSSTRTCWYALRASRITEGGQTLIIIAHDDVTLRKQLEEQVIRQAQLLANVNDIIIGTDKNFTITFLNPAAEKAFGWTSLEVIGLPAADVLRTEFNETNRAEATKALVEKGEWMGEVIQYTKEGQPLFLEANILTFFDSDGRIAGYVSANRDITLRKRAMMALQASEARFQNLTRSLPDAVYAIDLTKNQVTYFNHDTFLGYTREELMTSGSILNAIHPDDTAAVKAYWQKALISEAGNSIEYRLKNKAEKWEWVESRTTTLSKGADDTPSELIITLTLITERKEAERKLIEAKTETETANQQLQQALIREEIMARTDALTHTSNRRHFFDLAVQEFAVSHRYGRPLSIILFDIDHFKQVNDTYGHPIGDLVLQIVAQKATKNLREADILGRYGGEEFAIVLPDTNAQESLIVAERIREGIANQMIDTERGRFRVTVSLGVAEFLSQDDNLDQLIHRADDALYRAKQTGRNRTILV